MIFDFTDFGNFFQTFTIAFAILVTPIRGFGLLSSLAK
ncbi:hypothetical protein SF2A35B_0536 [Lactiplantibacillus plantarum]|nr:hypothetical protein SF2A35B_0536 [Lactiplantibacillus plantarum]